MKIFRKARQFPARPEALQQETCTKIKVTPRTQRTYRKEAERLHPLGDRRTRARALFAHDRRRHRLPHVPAPSHASRALDRTGAAALVARMASVQRQPFRPLGRACALDSRCAAPLARRTALCVANPFSGVKVCGGSTATALDASHAFTDRARRGTDHRARQPAARVRVDDLDLSA